MLILDVTNLSKAKALLAGLDDLMPGLPVVAVAHQIDAEFWRAD